MIKREVEITTVSVLEAFYLVGHSAFSFCLEIKENLETSYVLWHRNSACSRFLCSSPGEVLA